MICLMPDVLVTMTLMLLGSAAPDGTRLTLWRAATLSYVDWAQSSAPGGATWPTSTTTIRAAERPVEAMGPPP